MDYIFQLIDNHMDYSIQREQQKRERETYIRKLSYGGAKQEVVDNRQVLLNDQSIKEESDVTEYTKELISEPIIEKQEDKLKVTEYDSNFVVNKVSNTFSVEKGMDDNIIPIPSWNVDENLPVQTSFSNESIKTYTQSEVDYMLAHIEHEANKKYNQLYTNYMCLHEEYIAIKEKMDEYKTGIKSLVSLSFKKQCRVDELEKMIDNLMVYADVFKTELETLYKI